MSRLGSLVLLVCLSLACRARADDDDLFALGSPYSPLVRAQFYRQLEKSPARAVGWELLVPGAGNLYTGLTVPAVVTLGGSLLGASLWVAGALRDRSALMWSGIGVFAAARGYGLLSAPIGALLLNAAFRRQLGVTATY